MNLTKEELLHQKALVENHLRWLDSKIAGFSANDPATLARDAAAPIPVPHTSAEATASVGHDNAYTPAVSSPTPTHTFDEFPATDNLGGITLGQKVGCIGFAVLICVLFVGLLFGEYIMDFIKGFSAR